MRLHSYRRRHGSLYPLDWSRIERGEIDRQPYCTFCTATKVEVKLQVHHVLPVHLDARLVDGTAASGAAPSNLIVLCQYDHLREGHLGDFEKYYDPAIRARSTANARAILAARQASAEAVPLPTGR